MRAILNEALVPERMRIDANMVRCRDLLACQKFLLSTSGHAKPFAR